MTIDIERYTYRVEPRKFPGSHRWTWCVFDRQATNGRCGQSGTALNEADATKQIEAWIEAHEAGKDEADKWRETPSVSADSGQTGGG